MIEFQLNGHKLEFDETKTYSDFTVTDGKPDLYTINMEEFLRLLEEKAIEWNPLNWQWLSRWVHEAPRKRRLREMRSEGMNVLTGEFLFDGWPGADDFIDSLENTGNIAVFLLKAMGTYQTHPPFGPNWYKEHLSNQGKEDFNIVVSETNG